MTKRQIIDEIVSMNQTAKPAFLASFAEDDLNDYLRQLHRLRKPRLLGDASRFAHYFATGNSSQTEATNAVTLAEQSTPQERQALLEAHQDDFFDNSSESQVADCRDTRWRTGPDPVEQKVTAGSDDQKQPGLF